MTALPPTPEPGSGGKRARLRQLGARHGTAAVDQALSSISNVLAVVLVARSADVASFGRFSLAYAVVILVLGVNRTYLGTRITLSPGPAAAREMTSYVLGALVTAAPVLVLLVWLVAMLISGSSPLVLGVALIAPVVCIQDGVRYGSVATGRPVVAAVSDAVWAAVVVLALVSDVELSGAQAVAVWGVGAVLSAAVGLLMLGIRPAVRTGTARLFSRHPVGESMVFGRLVTTSASLLVVSVATAVIGPAAAAALRGASTLMGPLNSLFQLVHLTLTPVLVTRPRARDVRACALVLVGLVATTLTVAAVLLLLPSTWGRSLLGDSWDVTRNVLPWTVVEYVAISGSTAVLLGQKLRADARSIAWQQAALALTAVAGGVLAAVLTGDVRAVAAALAVASAVSASLGWTLFLRRRPATHEKLSS